MKYLVEIKSSRLVTANNMEEAYDKAFEDGHFQQLKHSEADYKVTINVKMV